MTRSSTGKPRKPSRPGRRTRVVRLLAVLGVVGVGATLMTTASNAEGEPSLAAVPRAHCGPGSRPETSIQGRVPARDYKTGRAQKGYTCNTRQVSHHGGSGGFKVFRYVDRTGRDERVGHLRHLHQLPAEDVTVEGPSPVPVVEGNLEMHDPSTHVRDPTRE